MSSAGRESLDARIIALEDRAARHRVRITDDTRSLQQAIHRRAVSGAAVFGAICLGVALGRRKKTDQWSVLNILNAINACTTLFVALSPSTEPADDEPVLPEPI